MSHLPKHAMLIALQTGRLSASGQARAERHLERCPVCRNAASGHRVLSELLASTRTLPALTATDRDVPLMLRQEARAQSLASTRRALFQALAVAAALGLLVFGSAWLAWTPRLAPTADGTPAAAPGSDVTNTGAASSDRRQASGTNASPSPDTAPSVATNEDGVTIMEGALLRASSEALTVVLWQGTELVLAPNSEARVVTFHDRQLHVTLLRGSITSQVARLGDNERYAIEVNEHLVTVRGTRFVVSKAADGSAEVVLSEGKVDITRAGELLSHLIAPARWVEDRSSDPTMRAITTKTGAVDEGGAPEALRLGKRTPAEHVVAGQVAPKAVQHLLARAAPLLRTCHEASKRTHPDLPSQVQLTLQIAATGQVEAVDVTAADTPLPEDLVSCLRARALTWHLTLQVAGPVQLRIPLQFGATR